MKTTLAVAQDIFLGIIKNIYIRGKQTKTNVQIHDGVTKTTSEEWDAMKLKAGTTTHFTTTTLYTTTLYTRYHYVTEKLKLEMQQHQT